MKLLLILCIWLTLSLNGYSQSNRDLSTFELLRRGLESSNMSLTKSNDDVYIRFKKQIVMQTSKKPLYDEAIDV
ncbi:MAG: hypothetical protein NTX03_09250 [Bacteroidetes bacterium]|nr:hypothetical protein [Bacteroidota bacterium]